MAAPPFNPSDLGPPDLNPGNEPADLPFEGSSGNSKPLLQSYAFPTADAFSSTAPSPASRSRIVNIPDLAHTFLFFILALVVLFVGELITVAIGRNLPPFRHEDLTTLASDARLMVPAQALQYAALLALTVLIFRALWHRPFWQGIQWNSSAAKRRRISLALLGVLLGLASSLASSYLPMPKEAPILNDLMNSTAGAWMMFLFATTGAPLIEELAFRGFLLPSLINAFRWLDRRRLAQMQSEQQERWNQPDQAEPIVVSSTTSGSSLLLGIPLSILLTSLPFALLHATQVSHAWAPVLLIGMVSVALCLIRLLTNSLAASTLVHAVYNFSLFAGMMIASDGFRHLEKLNN